MTWTTAVRRAHRSLSVAFTIGVIVNLAAFAQPASAAWIGLLALIPLVLLWLTGLYLFVLPYTTRGGSVQRPGSE
ncbi:MAG TPA: hypothetical protein VEL07_18025 [Planctomycetota bacterium]|nr:hypothetical protein [Planctomycetota bacterium]